MKRMIMTSAFALAMVLGPVSAYAQDGCELTDSCDDGDDGGLGGGGLGGVGVGGGPIKGGGTTPTPTPPAPSTPATGAPPPVGNSVTLNFNNIGTAFTTYIEGDYKITLLSGAVLGGSYGAQNTRSLTVLGPLAAAYVDTGIPNTISLTRVDGGLFSADSFFSVLGGSSGTNTQTLDGYLLNSLVSSSTTTSSVGGFAFSQASGLTGFYDQVRLTFSTTSSSSAFDNLTVTAPAATAAVPEAATWAMFIGGFAFVGGALRRQRRTGVSFA